MSAVIGAAIGAAGSLAGGVVNAIGNNRQGSKNRKHQLSTTDHATNV